MNDNKHPIDCGCSRCLECIIRRLQSQISTLQETNNELAEEAKSQCAIACKLRGKLFKLRWIPVSERPPEHSKQVWICYEKTGYTYNAYYDTIYKTWNIFDYSGGYKRAEDLPTHWREIDLPTGEQEQHNG